MSWFTRKSQPKPRVISSIGIFYFDGAGWLTEFREGELVFMCCKSDLDTRIIDQAKALLDKVEFHRQRALEYAKTHGDAWDGKCRLQLESIEITDILENKFGLTFSVESHPDETVSVEFIDGQPFDVWGAD
jgi:hypothetical protein